MRKAEALEMLAEERIITHSRTGMVLVSAFPEGEYWKVQVLVDNYPHRGDSQRLVLGVRQAQKLGKALLEYSRAILASGGVGGSKRGGEGAGA